MFTLQKLIAFCDYFIKSKSSSSSLSRTPDDDDDDDDDVDACELIVSTWLLLTEN